MRSRPFPITYRAFAGQMPLAMISIRPAAGNPLRGWLRAGAQILPVALGRGRIRANKREGDGSTPRGTYHPLRVWWRGDRLSRPSSHLPTRRITAQDAWCEDPNDRHYNRPILLKKENDGHDRLMRQDHLYDVIIEIDHNTRPRIAGRGSAVFIHLARDAFSPTAGCVGLRRGDLLRLVARLGPETRIVIG